MGVVGQSIVRLNKWLVKNREQIKSSVIIFFFFAEKVGGAFPIKAQIYMDKKAMFFCSRHLKF